MSGKSQRDRGRHTVLVVDAQDQDRTTVRGMLEGEGLRVLTADSGECAIAVFREHDVHLVLVEYGIGRMAAERLIGGIRAVDPFVQVIVHARSRGRKAPRSMLEQYGVHGCCDSAGGAAGLLPWVQAALKAHHLVADLRSRERMRMDVVADLSQEARAALEVIGGAAALVRAVESDCLSGRGQALLARIEGAAENLAELVDTLQRCAGSSGGVARVSEKVVAAGELADELAAGAALLIQGRGIRFAVDVEGGPAALATDAGTLRTILRALIARTVRMTASGLITLRIEPPNGAVRVTVTAVGSRPDDGAGASPPGIQIRDESVVGCERRGPDVGLAFAKRLARLLGGDIEARADGNGWSEFALVLPAGVACPAASLESPAGSGLTREAGGLLVAEGFS